jgi:hypothetical protein
MPERIPYKIPLVYAANSTVYTLRNALMWLHTTSTGVVLQTVNTCELVNGRARFIIFTITHPDVRRLTPELLEKAVSSTSMDGSETDIVHVITHSIVCMYENMAELCRNNSTYGDMLVPWSIASFPVLRCVTQNGIVPDDATGMIFVKSLHDANLIPFCEGGQYPYVMEARFIPRKCMQLFATIGVKKAWVKFKECGYDTEAFARDALVRETAGLILSQQAPLPADAVYWRQEEGRIVLVIKSRSAARFATLFLKMVMGTDWCKMSEAGIFMRITEETSVSRVQDNIHIAIDFRLGQFYSGAITACDPCYIVDNVLVLHITHD